MPDHPDGDDGPGQDDPPVIHSHLAYFFVPLPDPLALPDKHIIRCTAPTSGDWYWEPCADDHRPPPPVHMAASLVFHRSSRPSPQIDEVDRLFALARELMPPPAEPVNVAGSPTAAAGPGSAPCGDGPPHADTTVVEMAVAFDIPDAGPSADEAMWDGISDAFDLGLVYVREIQRAHYIARRRPIRLVAREALPTMIPVAVRRLADDDGHLLPFAAPINAFLLNPSITNDFVGSDLDEEEARAFGSSLGAQADRAPFVGYLEFVREADVALDLHGDYRAAVLFAATACEILFDELLAHLLWEDNTRPEDAAETFDSWLIARVKSQYHPRLHGTWSLDVPGPLADWHDKVAGLRNRVVHSGYEPTVDQTLTARQAARALESWLADRVAACAPAYPRTAIALCGPPGLRRRGKWTKALDRLIDDPAEIHWHTTFAGWRDAMHRFRTDSPTYVEPSAARSYVMVVVRQRTGAPRWVAHDRAARMAAVLPGGPEDVRLSTQQVAGVEASLAALTREPPDDDVSIAIVGATPLHVDRLQWQPEYTLVPGTGVMVDGDDLERA
jgi:hypothetical protein